MTTKEKVLEKLLCTTEFISGEELAKELNISRAAIWKAIKSLQKDGYKIEGVTNSGYRFVVDNKVVTVPAVKKALNYDIEVMHFDTIDSTNTYCKRLLADGKQGEFLVTADYQTAGRGRQGKSFYSPDETGIYFSLVVRPDTTLQNAVTATTATAVAVCKAIEKLTPRKPKIKWVNDVYLDGKKICGILTEAVTNFETGIVDSVIIGIGINVNTSAFPSDVKNAGCLDYDVNRSKLIAETVNQIMNYINGDKAQFMNYYREHSLVLGEKVRFYENGTTNVGIAKSIDSDGGLEVVLQNGETRMLRSGEISLRKYEE